jgi:hypothetical protein
VKSGNERRFWPCRSGEMKREGEGGRPEAAGWVSSSSKFEK